MNKKIIEYIIIVEGKLIDGHPVQRIDYNLTTASRSLDEFQRLYPRYTIRMFQVVKEEIKIIEGIKVIDNKCPRGHKGLDWNKKPVVCDNGRGMLICSVCGWIGESEIKEIK